MDEFLAQIEEWVKNLGVTDDAVLRKIRAGDLTLLQKYSHSLGASYAKLFEPMVLSEIFENLSNKDKADFVRTYLTQGVVESNRLASVLAYEALNKTLNNRGLLFSPVNAPLDEQRLKDVVAGGLAWMIDKQDTQAGVNTLHSGFQQVIDSGVRNTIVETSKKVKSNTGSFLKGSRVIVGSNPCDYCRALAVGDFDLVNEAIENMKFHDHCNCRIKLV